MFLQLQIWAFLLLQESGAVGWDVRSLWIQMGSMAKAVVIILFLMSAWSIGVMIDRMLAYNGARKQSRLFAPAVAGALREGKLDEAIKIADRYKKSHLAKVVVAGLQEFRAHQMSTEISGEDVEASKRALERAAAIVHAELKRGVSTLGDDRLDGPLRGAVRNGGRHHQRVQGDFDREVDRFGRGGGRYFRGPGDHGHRFVRGHPGGLDVQLLHEQGRSVRRRDGQLQFGTDRLLPEAVPAGRRRQVSAAG